MNSIRTVPELTKVYEFRDYKLLIRNQINLHRQHRGYQAKLARAAGCLPSYFSGVLTSSLHLKPEHVVGIASVCGFDFAETEYFRTLVLWQRTECPRLRNHLECLLDRMRKEAGVNILAESYACIENQQSKH